MAIVNVKGQAIHYQHQPGNTEAGATLFIHGAGGNHQVWSLQMESGQNCFALDLPGHGSSDGKPVASIVEAAELVKDFIAAANLPRPLYLVGHSMGAAIALTCALRYAGTIDGIVIIGSGPRMKVNSAFLENLHQGKSDPDFIRLGFSPQTTADIVAVWSKIFNESSPELLYTDFAACNDFNVSEQVGEISLPVLIISGVDDMLTPPKLSQYLATHIPQVRLAVIEDAGHFVMIEKPGQVNKLIKDFCADIAPTDNPRKQAR